MSTYIPSSLVESLTAYIDTIDDWTPGEIAQLSILMASAEILDQGYHAQTANGYGLQLRNLQKGRAEKKKGTALGNALADLDDDEDE